MKKLLILLTVMMLSFGALHAAQAAETAQYTVKAGDTLWAIANELDTTVVKLLDLNPGITPDRLQVGQKIAVPVDVLWSYHVVQPGDNAKSLAAQYRVPLEGLMEANNLNSTKLTVGQTIRIPMHLYIPPAEEKETTHVVEIGETLFQIAKQYKVTLAELVEWNNLEDPDMIFAGQKLIVG